MVHGLHRSSRKAMLNCQLREITVFIVVAVFVFLLRRFSSINQ